MPASSRAFTLRSRYSMPLVSKKRRKAVQFSHYSVQLVGRRVVSSTMAVSVRYTVRVEPPP